MLAANGEMLAYEEPKCKNCRFCEMYTDEDLCKRLVCRATRSKKGRTIIWTMLCFDANLLSYFAEHVEKHPRPKWCPRAKEEIL